MSQKFGFKTKSVINERGFFAGQFLVVLKNGNRQTIEGRSKERMVSRNYKTMIEEARLHAVSQVLYKNGYYVEASNYEELDIDKVSRVELIDYNFYYTENQFQTYSKVERNYKKKGRVSYVVERDSKGRFAKFHKDNSKEISSNYKRDLDSRYDKKERRISDKKQDFARKYS